MYFILLIVYEGILSVIMSFAFKLVSQITSVARNAVLADVVVHVFGTVLWAQGLVHFLALEQGGGVLLSYLRKGRSLADRLKEGMGSSRRHAPLEHEFIVDNVPNVSQKVGFLLLAGGGGEGGVCRRVR